MTPSCLSLKMRYHDGLDDERLDQDDSYLRLGWWDCITTGLTAELGCLLWP